MSEPQPANEERVDIRDLFDPGKGVARKRERQRALAEALAGPRAAQPEHDPELARLLDAALERLRELEPQEAEPEPFFTAVAGAQHGRKRALLAALAGRSADPAVNLSEAGRVSFDGGARTSLPPPPPTHEETLLNILATRAADKGAWF
jgi:hypothetical protein